MKMAKAMKMALALALAMAVALAVAVAFGLTHVALLLPQIVVSLSSLDESGAV